MRRYVTTLLLVGLLLGLLVLATTATPLRVEAATSDAMAPTIESGDAYVTVPVDRVERGNVVVFWAPEEGRFLTRSVLEAGDGVYSVGTGGDSGDARVVPRSAIVAEVLTVGGAPVVLPGLGGPLSALAEFRIVALSLALLLGAAWITRSRLASRATDRTATIRVRTVAVPLLAVLFVTCVAITPLSATSYQLTYGGETGGDDPGADGDLTRNVSLPVATPPFTQWVVRGEAVTVERWSAESGTINATLSVPPPGEAGQSVVAVHLFPYPAWVPRGLLEATHGVHPVVASLLGAALPVGPLALLYRLLLDGGRPIARVRRRRLYVLGRR
jgi:signal peptidase